MRHFDIFIKYIFNNYTHIKLLILLTIDYKKSLLFDAALDLS